MNTPLFAAAEPARGILSLTGEDSASFLQGLVSNDTRLLAPDRALWAALLTAQGKFLHDFFLLRFGPRVLLEGEGGRIAELKKRLGLYKLRAKVAIDGALPASGTLVTRPDGGEAGEIRSGQDGRALALIRLEALDAGGPFRAGTATVTPLPPDWLQRPAV